ncbi:hypothetical protein [Sedimenticola selenatireducens]|uniref:Uncharacterized protein n=1 Tax=Sedimenticola selenatireducens TaxID=191960 RepID=A0A557SNP8_9GAMM|nr:hypothetical protein [Sedimenticola selenatireducens]TVO79051.1 hypothetical protein FHP88_00365 [Sedimenticola selenatireducens]TVT67157.1 MAG: hypothetical protein FHK78_00030 [Sedimenticola selenatireducens]
MPDLKDLPPEDRISRYRAELDRHEGKHGYTSVFMFNLYSSLLASAQQEIEIRERAPEFS